MPGSVAHNPARAQKAASSDHEAAFEFIDRPDIAGIDEGKPRPLAAAAPVFLATETPLCGYAITRAPASRAITSAAGEVCAATEASVAAR